MTDTGQIPAEGLPENAGNGVVSGPAQDLEAQPDTHATGAYPHHLDPSAPRTPDHDPASVTGTGDAWTEALPNPSETGADQVDPGARTGSGAPEAAARDAGAEQGEPSVPAPRPAPARRPLHLGPPMPEASSPVVRSLADRGPAQPASVALFPHQTPAPAYAPVPSDLPRVVAGPVAMPADDPTLAGPQLSALPPYDSTPWASHVQPEGAYRSDPAFGGSTAQPPAPEGGGAVAGRTSGHPANGTQTPVAMAAAVHGDPVAYASGSGYEAGAVYAQDTEYGAEYAGVNGAGYAAGHAEPAGHGAGAALRTHGYEMPHPDAARHPEYPHEVPVPAGAQQVAATAPGLAAHPAEETAHAYPAVPEPVQESGSPAGPAEYQEYAEVPGQFAAGPEHGVQQQPAEPLVPAGAAAPAAPHLAAVPEPAPAAPQDPVDPAQQGLRAAPAPVGTPDGEAADAPAGAPGPDGSQANPSTSRDVPAGQARPDGQQGDGSGGEHVDGPAVSEAAASPAGGVGSEESAAPAPDGHEQSAADVTDASGLQGPAAAVADGTPVSEPPAVDAASGQDPGTVPAPGGAVHGDPVEPPSDREPPAAEGPLPADAPADPAGSAVPSGTSAADDGTAVPGQQAAESGQAPVAAQGPQPVPQGPVQDQDPAAVAAQDPAVEPGPAMPRDTVAEDAEPNPAPAGEAAEGPQEATPAPEAPVAAQPPDTAQTAPGAEQNGTPAAPDVPVPQPEPPAERPPGDEAGPESTVELVLTADPASSGEPSPEAGTAPEAEPPSEEALAAEDGPAPADVPVSGGAAPATDTLPAPAFGEAEREAVLRVMRERRDVRNGFRSDPIPHDVLLRVLEAAHAAPSVGHSQPWDFVVIRSEETRRTVHALAMHQREAYAKSLPKGRAKQFKKLKVEAILDTPVNIVVTADRTRGGRHILGRHSQPQMAPYSAALAVENLWLAARAEGLGVGWVSFFDERELVRALDLPDHLDVVAYLCVGYVDEFPDEPELVQSGWSKRRPLSWVVHDEAYGRRALPGSAPHDLLAETVAGIRPLDAKALGEAWERQKRMTKPHGSLGMLEIISAQLSGLSRMCPPPVPEPAAVAVFAGDHGVHAQGVTPWPQEVTGQMVANFLAGGAVCNAFAAQVGAEVCVVDVGVACDVPAVPGLLPRKVRAGTADMTTGPALTRDEVKAAIEVGIETARDLVAAGNKALLTGEMGIANTTVSAALIAVFTGAEPAEVTGRGTGVNDETLALKAEVVRRALELHQPDPGDPIGVLAAVGGLEHAAITGLLLGGASLRTPVVLDGVSAGAAALVARAIAPEVLAACIAGHRSAEPGHQVALTTLGLRPLIDLDLRLGEGTGALLALPLIQSAARAMHEVATFDAAGVTEK